MTKLAAVCPHTLEGDLGWRLRDLYHELMGDLERYDKQHLDAWIHASSETDLRLHLKRSLLAFAPVTSAPDADMESEDNDDAGRRDVKLLMVNLDEKLLETLRDAQYLQQEPYNVLFPFCFDWFQLVINDAHGVSNTAQS